MPALARLLGPQPDTIPEPACICRVLDAIGSNPTCPDHPWWRHDPTVLQLADHPDGPWQAALKVYGGSQ